MTTTQEVVNKWFKPYDANGDGKLNQSEFFALAEAFVPGTPEPLKEEIYQGITSELKGNYEVTHDEIDLHTIATQLNFETIRDVQKALNKQESVKKVFEDLKESLKNLTNSDETQNHHVGVSFGNTEHAKTAFDFKFFFNNDCGKKHFDEAAKGLTFKKEHFGLIIKLHTSNPGVVKTKIEETWAFAKEMATMALSDLSFIVDIIFNTTKIEFHVEEGHAISIGIHSEFKPVLFAFEVLTANIHHLKLDNVKGSIHLRAAANGSLADLEKFGGDLSKVVCEGFAANLDVKTNADEFLKKAIDIAALYCQKSCYYDSQKQQCKIQAGLAKQFFTNGFKVHIGADEFTVLKKPLKVFEGEYLEMGKEVIIGSFEALKSLQLPPVDAFLDLVENHLDANFHLSFNTPHIFTQVHVKTTGLKQTIDKIKSL